MENAPKETLVHEYNDPLINFLNKIVIYCVKFLAILMVIVIIWSIIDVLFNLYRQMGASIESAFSVENLISMFGAFLAVLIAIEIFLNIIFYLTRDAIHVPLVLATALTAVARKVIVLDYTKTTPHFIYATAAVILAIGLSYWLVTKKKA